MDPNNRKADGSGTGRKDTRFILMIVRRHYQKRQIQIWRIGAICSYQIEVADTAVEYISPTSSR